MIRSEQQNKMKFTLFTAFLFSIGWMSFEVAGQDVVASCCLTVSKTRVPVENVLEYYVQNPAICNGIRAVRFLTKKNITICSDPDDKWAKKVIAEVDNRRITEPYKEPIKCYTSIKDMIPTVTTTNKTLGTKTETSTIIPPTEMTIKTSGPETSTSTTVPPTVIKLLKTNNTVTTTLTSVSKENPESSQSSATTCGTGEPTAPPTATRKIPEIGTVTPLTKFTTTDGVISKTSHKKKKLSKIMKRKNGKSKKGLRKFQMGITLNNKSR